MPNELVIIPTYNEKENVANIIHAVFEQRDSFHILIVDDGSPDGTADIVQDLIQSGKFENRLHIVQRSGKLGLGTAYIKGFKWGLERDYDFLFEIDADFSHNPKDLVRLLMACHQGADAAVGSRYVSGGKLENWPKDRIFLSKAASLYVRIVTWMPIMDPTAGFICYSKNALNALDLDKITFKGYAFQIQMKFALTSLGFKIKEVPITFKDREKGKSKMSANIIHEAIFGVLRMRIQSFFNSYRRSTAV